MFRRSDINFSFLILHFSLNIERKHAKNILKYTKNTKYTIAITNCIFAYTFNVRNLNQKKILLFILVNETLLINNVLIELSNLTPTIDRSYSSTSNIIFFLFSLF